MQNFFLHIIYLIVHIVDQVLVLHYVLVEVIIFQDLVGQLFYKLVY